VAENIPAMYICSLAIIVDNCCLLVTADPVSNARAAHFCTPVGVSHQRTPAGQEDIDHYVPKPEFAILTANETEQNVVRRYLKLGDSGRVWEGLKEYDWKCDPLLQKKNVEMKSLGGTEDYEVFAIGKVTGVHVKCTRYGPGGAQKTTFDLLRKASEEKWPLKVIFVVGCCGVSMSDAAKKKKNWRGTVLLSDLVDNYMDSGKLEGGKVVTRHYTFTLSPAWRNYLSEVSIVRPDVQDQRYRDIPCEKVDKYLSGPLVIKSEEEGNRFRGDSEMAGIEMEGTSVQNVVGNWPGQDTVEVTVVKGISDYGAKDKNEKFPSVVFGRETERELEDEHRQEIATFHAITLVARCIASQAHLFQ